MSRDHRKLEVFTIADQLAIDVYLATRVFPTSETFGLRAQVRRAALSVSTNVVEGAARRTTAEYLHFLSVALGSAREVRYLVSFARRLGMLEQTSAKALEDRYGLLEAKFHRLSQALAPMRKLKP